MIVIQESELYKKVADAFQGNTAHCQRGRNSYGPCILIQIVSHGETNDPQQNASWEYPPDPLRRRVCLNGFYEPSYSQRILKSNTWTFQVGNDVFNAG